MCSNAGKVMSIYDIPSITKIAFNVAITAKNILAGFTATRIWPVNTDVFGESDVIPSQFTDRVLIDTVSEQVLNVNDNSEIRITIPNESVDVRRNENIANREQNLCENPQHSIEPIAFTFKASSDHSSSSNAFSPEVFRPLPKASLRKGKQTYRRKIKSDVLTDSPVRNEILAIEASRKIKKIKTPNSTKKNLKTGLPRFHSFQIP